MRKLFAVLAVSTAVLTVYSAGAEFKLLVVGKEIQKKLEERQKLPSRKPNMKPKKPR